MPTGRLLLPASSHPLPPFASSAQEELFSRLVAQFLGTGSVIAAPLFDFTSREQQMVRLGCRIPEKCHIFIVCGSKSSLLVPLITHRPRLLKLPSETKIIWK